MEFLHSVEAGGDYEGMISLRAPLYGVARYDILVRFIRYAAYKLINMSVVVNDSLACGLTSVEKPVHGIRDVSRCVRWRR